MHRPDQHHPCKCCSLSDCGQRMDVLLPSLFRLRTVAIKFGGVVVFIKDTTLLSFHIRHSTFPPDTITDLCSPRFRVLFILVESSSSFGHFFLLVLAVPQQKVFLDRRISAILTLEKSCQSTRCTPCLDTDLPGLILLFLRARILLPLQHLCRY